MNTALITHLIQLRYKLMWAKTRSRNGRIALFLTGYLLLLLLLALLSTGGFGAALLAARSGRTEQIAQVVFGAMFFQAIISANLLGFGMNAVFSETELRRYPLSATDRGLARHLIGILDPFWFLFLAIELGLAIGLYAVGAAGFWNGMAAVLLLLLSNYLAARVVAVFIDRLMQRKMNTVLLAMILPLAFLPMFFQRKPGAFTELAKHLHGTPPFAAASLLVGQPWSANGAVGLPVLLGWVAGLVVVLVYLEKHPVQHHAAASVKIAWNSPIDRIGTLFGPRLAPFVAHWLRFYARNSRTRTMMLLSVPMAAFFTYSMSTKLGPNALFVAALGTISIASFFGTSRLCVNQFGYSGGAFRRYFLLPTAPGAILRAASFASLTLGAAALVIALVVWMVAVPLRFDARMPLMLLASGTTGLFLFNACGIWVTLYNPRKGNYYSAFGNDLSLGGNIVLIGGMMSALLLPRLFNRLLPAAVDPANWYFVLPVAAIAIAFYVVSVNAAGPLFAARREKLLAVVEGRN